MARKITSGSVGTTVDFKTNNVDISTNTLVTVGDVCFCDTTAAAITLTLPATPSKGDTVEVYDIANTFDTNNLTIDRNGKPIMSGAENLVVNTEGAAFALIFYDDTRGWRLFTI